MQRQVVLSGSCVLYYIIINLRTQQENRVRVLVLFTITLKTLPTGPISQTLLKAITYYSYINMILVCRLGRGALSCVYRAKHFTLSNKNTEMF